MVAKSFANLIDLVGCLVQEAMPCLQQNSGLDVKTQKGNRCLDTQVGLLARFGDLIHDCNDFLALFCEESPPSHRDLAARPLPLLFGNCQGLLPGSSHDSLWQSRYLAAF